MFASHEWENNQHVELKFIHVPNVNGPIPVAARSKA